MLFVRLLAANVSTRTRPREFFSADPVAPYRSCKHRLTDACRRIQRRHLFVRCSHAETSPGGDKSKLNVPLMTFRRVDNGNLLRACSLPQNKKQLPNLVPRGAGWIQLAQNKCSWKEGAADFFHFFLLSSCVAMSCFCALPTLFGYLTESFPFFSS